MRSLLLATLLASISFGAQAQMSCGPYERVKDRIETMHKEHLKVVGLDNSGKMIQIFADEDGTWTFIMVGPNGTACLFDSGEALQIIDKPTSSKKDMKL